SLTYTPAQLLLRAGYPTSSGAPAVTGGTPTAFDVTPPLPQGLTLDSQSGVISGVSFVASPQTTYVVKASNSDGFVTQSITIEIIEPATVKYISGGLHCNFNRQCSFSPTVSGTPVDSFSLSASLPAGFSFDTATGTVSGSSREPTTVSWYE